MVQSPASPSPATSSTGLGRGSVASLRELLRQRQPAAVGASADQRLEPSGAIPAEPGRDGAALPLVALIAEYTAIFRPSWSPATRRKHADDFRRYLEWLESKGLPGTTASLDFLTLARYVEDLRSRPKVTGVWRGAPGALARALAAGPTLTLSANSVNAYVRPLRSLAIWLVDEGLLSANPFRRSRRRAALNPLLPSEDTPTKSATLDDLRALERGCAGDQPLDLRDQAIVSVMITTAARNSSVRLLRVGDIDLERAVILFRRAKGGKTLEITLHPETRGALDRYLDHGRPALVGRSTRSSADGSSETADPGWLFPSAAGHRGHRPLKANAVSLMLTRRYHVGGGTLRSFGSHRIRHATATLLANNGMPLEEVSRYLGHSSTLTTRRYAIQSTKTLGQRAADALARAGLVAG